MRERNSGSPGGVFRLKIALVSPYDFAYKGGVVSHVVSLGNELSRRGHNVKILAPCSDPEQVETGEVELIPFGRSVPIPSAGSISRISFSVWHRPRLKATLENEAFDVVHLHEPLMPMFALMCCFLAKAPKVGTFHAFNEGRGSGYTIWKPVLAKGASRLAGRIAVSEPARDFANRYFPGDYKVIPNGIDVERFGKPAPWPALMDRDKTNILFVGRMGEKRKGLRYLLGAYSTLKWEFPDLRLVIVGPGEPDPTSYLTMGERAIDDVVFAGPVSDDELPGYYQAADIFCSPATGKESFGYVVVEAMAAGTPVVATSIPGFLGVMRDGEQGFLVEPKSEESIAAALRILILDRTLRHRLGAAGRISAQQYRWDRLAESVVDCYRAAIQQTPAAVGAI